MNKSNSWLVVQKEDFFLIYQIIDSEEEDMLCFGVDPNEEAPTLSFLPELLAQNGNNET